MAFERTPDLARSLLVGRTWEGTRRALLLAVVLFIATAALRAGAPGTALHSCCHRYVYAVLEPFDIGGGGRVALPFAQAAVTMTLLAGIQAFFNDGLLPSLLVALAPSFGLYTFNGPGAAPLWAADLLLPYALTYGTLGFVLGVCLRRGRRYVDQMRTH